MNKLSIIIPTLNEAEHIRQTLNSLQGLQNRGQEIIVVDGGSEDETIGIAKECVNNVISSKKGRALQMNKGAEQASGDVLLFLHADSRLPQNADRLIESALNENKQWGRFDVRLNGVHWMFPIISFMMNLRSRITGVATGDQAIFVTRELFNSINGFPNISLMEDIALCKTLRKTHWPACIRQKAITSGRRWEKHGVFRTILLMWRLRFAYFLGADPDELHKLYSR